VPLRLVPSGRASSESALASASRLPVRHTSGIAGRCAVYMGQQSPHGRRTWLQNGVGDEHAVEDSGKVSDHADAAMIEGRSLCCLKELNNTRMAAIPGRRGLGERSMQSKIWARLLMVYVEGGQRTRIQARRARGSASAVGSSSALSPAQTSGSRRRSVRRTFVDERPEVCSVSPPSPSQRFTSRDQAQGCSQALQHLVRSAGPAFTREGVQSDEAQRHLVCVLFGPAPCGVQK
jgi:hypothetical protein